MTIRRRNRSGAKKNLQALNNRPGDGVEVCVTENYATMKPLITAIVIGLFAFVGTAATSEARPCGGRGYHTPANTIYVSGYRYGRPVYTEKIFVGYDCHGRPRFTYRTVCAPRRQYAPPCPPRQYGDHGHHGYQGHSGSSLSFTFRR